MEQKKTELETWQVERKKTRFWLLACLKERGWRLLRFELKR